MLFSTSSIFYRVLTVCMFAISLKLAFVGGGAVPSLCPPAPGTGCCELELTGGGGGGGGGNGTAWALQAGSDDTCAGQPGSRPSAGLATCTCVTPPAAACARGAVGAPCCTARAGAVRWLG
jgi:hypothetical protein